ncbi:uncharacterized protein [Euwallacea fornicatus]|uniref:uncharacterized protein n=1 Tax=Euwallacea fornicatus TaxID=995702 RepID=UPI00338DF40E
MKWSSKKLFNYFKTDMSRFMVLGLFLSLCSTRSKSQNLTESASSIVPQTSAPNFDSPSVFQVTQPVDHSEGPMWDGRKNILYFVDIHSGRVLSYNYNTKKVNYITLKGAVTPVIPAKKSENILIVGVERSLVAIEWDGEKELGSQRTLTTVSHQFPQSRFNDGKADKQGRVWIGTMGFEDPQTRALDPNQGMLYKMTKDTLISPKVEVAPVNISNGLCWNQANDKMYYIDTPTRKVIEYEFDDERGDISNPRVAIDISKFPYVTGNPDGMTIDQDDNLWIALYFGGSVIKANPRNGQLLQVVPIPARDVTSVMWGGPNMDILFVTTSRYHLSESERRTYPAAGSVFAVTNLKQKGLQPYYADLVNSVRRSNLIAEIILNTNELFAPPNPSANEVVSYPPLNSQKKRTASESAQNLDRHLIKAFVLTTKAREQLAVLTITSPARAFTDPQHFFNFSRIMSNSFKQQPAVTQLTAPANIGESPVWDKRVGKLFFVDIHHGRLMAYDYENQTTEVAAEFPGKDLAPIIMTKTSPNVMIGGLNRDLVKIALYNETAEPEVLHTVQRDKPKNRFNDGKADGKGRIWIGTIGDEPPNGRLELHAAALFQFTKENIAKPEILVERVSISNGLTWSIDGTKFYYIDSPTQEIVKYDYDAETGNIANRTVIFSTKDKQMGFPDGMTIDEDGNLWIALYGGGSVIQVNPADGSLLRRIPIPAAHTTSVAWGGPNLDVLFVTTSKRSLTPQEKEGQPGAGSLYAVTNLGTKGIPEFEADI